jgi:hypothetical protein
MKESVGQLATQKRASLKSSDLCVINAAGEAMPYGRDMAMLMK